MWHWPDGIGTACVRTHRTTNRQEHHELSQPLSRSPDPEPERPRRPVRFHRGYRPRSSGSDRRRLRTVTDYRTLIARIDAVAGALAARGVGSVTSSPSSHRTRPPSRPVPRHPRAGATATTVNALYTAADIRGQLADSKAQWLFTVSALLPQATEAAAAVGLPDDRLVVIDDAPGHPSLSDLLAEDVPAPDVSFDPATHLAVLPYSSGTTGRPRA